MFTTETRTDRAFLEGIVECDWLLEEGTQCDSQTCKGEYLQLFRGLYLASLTSEQLCKKEGGCISLND